MAKQNRINALFGIRYPIISGGMVWCSGWRLASAVSQAGGLGLIGAGSMHPEVLREHIVKCRAATDKPFGVNVPLLYPEIETIMKIIVDERVPIVFTSAGNPKTWTRKLKDEGIKVAHVVSSSKFAAKCEEAEVDVVVVEGFEAGGHNGTTLNRQINETAAVTNPQNSAVPALPPPREAANRWANSSTDPAASENAKPAANINPTSVPPVKAMHSWSRVDPVAM